MDQLRRARVHREGHSSGGRGARLRFHLQPRRALAAAAVHDAARDGGGEDAPRAAGAASAAAAGQTSPHRKFYLMAFSFAKVL